jgi:oligopeptide transport system substrate-binding protein
MKKFFPLLFVLIAMVAFACGGGSDAEPDAAAQNASPSQNEVQNAPAQSSQDDGTGGTTSGDSPDITLQVPDETSPQPGGGVFKRLWADPPTLDPHLTGDTTSAGVVVEIFSGLVALNTDLELVPDLAESWAIDDTGTVYTFKLRDNLTFHNGKRVTAEDVKWSLERAASPKLASHLADTYLNDIIGAQSYIDGNAGSIEGVQVIDDRTLQISIDAPKAYFLAKMSYPTAYVLDRDTVESGGRNWWVSNAVGTGPFRLKEYRIGERIVLERFDGYYRDPRPDVDAINMNLAGGQAMAMYENDEIDVTGVGMFDIERILDPNEPLNKDLVVAPPGFSVSYVGMNTSIAPFDDSNFRRALNHAIDKELIADEVLAELVKPAYSILPPGFPGYSTDIQGLHFDPDMAREFLAKSQYADPDSRPRIVITVPGTGGTIGLDLEVIIEMWKQELGVEVEIQQVEWATYLEDLDARKFQAYAGLGWSADYPDPQDFLDILFHSDSGMNHGSYSNADVDNLLEQARVVQDPIKRVELYNQAEQLIVDDAAWVPTWFTGEQYALVKPSVKGYRLTPMIVPKLQEIRLD